MEAKHTEAALRWIVGILRERTIPFQIAGGFAARLYGAKRALADIDIGIPDNRMDELYAATKEYVVFGPAQYTDEEWDLQLMTLNYEGQEIDIAGEDNIKLFDKETKTWIPATRDLSLSENMEAFGLIVPVIPKEALIAYKKKLGRDVDLEDVKELES